jgi:mannitol 2-dehydrogenase
MIDYLPVEDDNQSLITAMADPRIRIVSLTITEGGYFLDPETGGLDVAHPDIRHDAENLDRPRTAFGAMVAALRIRHANGIAPFSGLCCDNLLGNGEILRQSVVGWIASCLPPDRTNGNWPDASGWMTRFRSRMKISGNGLLKTIFALGGRTGNRPVLNFPIVFTNMKRRKSVC